MTTLALTALLAVAHQNPVPPAKPPVVVVEPDRESLPVEEVKVTTGTPRTLKADRPCRWEPCDDVSLKVVRDPSGLRATVVATKPGRFKLFVYASDDADPAVKLIVADGESPAPPPDNPPKPPVPPPTPPVGPVRKKLADAFAEDGPAGAVKEANRKRLVELYRQAADICADKSILTAKFLFEKVKDAGKGLTADQLPKTRTAVMEILNASVPTGPGEALTDDTRKSVSALFTKFAEVLEGVK